jgi:hypothetical protein
VTRKKITRTDVWQRDRTHLPAHRLGAFLDFPLELSLQQSLDFGLPVGCLVQCQEIAEVVDVVGRRPIAFDVRRDRPIAAWQIAVP